MPKLAVEIELRDCDDPLATVRVDSAQLFGLFDVYSGTVWDTSSIPGIADDALPWQEIDALAHAAWLECCASRSA